MNVNEVKRQIHDRKLDNFYVFTGDEIEAQRIYINKIAEVTGKSVKRVEQVSDAFNRRASILKVSNVFVCRDDMEFWRSATSFENITELLGENILIIQMTDIDKRSKSSKLYEGRIVTFNYMDADVLYTHVRAICDLSDDNTYSLIEMCENDYSRILLECDKIKQYQTWLETEGYEGTSADEYLKLPASDSDSVFERLVEDGAIVRPPKDAIFEFVDAMLRADISNAFRLLQECKDIGEPPLRVISVLYSNFKRVLQVQVCEDADVCKTTGLSAWDVKLAKKHVGCWSGKDLVFFLRTLQSIEKALKLGELEEDCALDFLMATIL